MLTYDTNQTVNDLIDVVKKEKLVWPQRESDKLTQVMSFESVSVAAED